MTPNILQGGNCGFKGLPSSVKSHVKIYITVYAQLYLKLFLIMLYIYCKHLLPVSALFSGRDKTPESTKDYFRIKPVIWQKLQLSHG